ncbi:integral membrane protein [Mycobacterium tuberculosis]|nr:integral membrane protein [Mycobacterium tuberculosis]
MISLIAGIVVMASPLETLLTLALVVGIAFVVIGALEFVASFGIYRASKQLRATDPQG